VSRAGVFLCENPVSEAASSRVAPGLVALRSRSGVALIMATVLASAAGTLDATDPQVAVPAIGRAWHAGVAGLHWTLTGYLLTVAALLLLSGARADRFGRRRLVTVGLCTMLVAAVGCSLAPSKACWSGHASFKAPRHPRPLTLRLAARC
jgi:MFS family permease